MSFQALPLSVILPMKGKTILLGVTGSIAAYKAADLLRDLQNRGAEVHVILTESAQKFIPALTLKTLSRNPVMTSLWDEENDWCPGHIELADKADLLLVAPATANVIAEFAQGLAPDLLTCVHLATKAPVLIAPAMNGKMLEHPATQNNRKILESWGHQFVDPVVGDLACGYSGNGKLSPIEVIADKAEELLNA